jgi:hypothetical protein
MGTRADKAERRIVNVVYKSDNEAECIIHLTDLLAKFRAYGVKVYEDDMRADLASRGWYEGSHDDGRYIVINLAKFDQVIQPTAHWL